jgi:hypothetical protein
MTTFRSTSRRLLAVLLATTAAASMAAAGSAQLASAAPPDSGLGAQGVGDGPVGPSGCRGDCGGFGDPRPYQPPRKKCGPGTAQPSCEPRPGCSGGVCTPPPPPLDPAIKQQIDQYSDASAQCDAGNADGCDYIHTHSMPVLPGTHTGNGGGFIQMFPTRPDGTVDICAGAPESIGCKEQRAAMETAKNKNGINPADFESVDPGPDPAEVAAANDNAVDPGLAEFARDNGIDPAVLADFFGNS